MGKFQIGDEVEVLIPNWAGPRQGIVVHVQANGAHHVRIGTYTYKWLEAWNLRLVSIIVPSLPTDAGAEEYEQAMAAEDAWWNV